MSHSSIILPRATLPCLYSPCLPAPQPYFLLSLQSISTPVPSSLPLDPLHFIVLLPDVFPYMLPCPPHHPILLFFASLSLPVLPNPLICPPPSLALSSPAVPDLPFTSLPLPSFVLRFFSWFFPMIVVLSLLSSAPAHFAPCRSRMLHCPPASLQSSPMLPCLLPLPTPPSLYYHVTSSAYLYVLRFQISCSPEPDLRYFPCVLRCHSCLPLSFPLSYMSFHITPKSSSVPL